MSIPRVERHWDELHPKLDIDAPLAVTVIDSSAGAVPAGTARKRDPQTEKSSILHQVPKRKRPFSDAFSHIGYTLEPYKFARTRYHTFQEDPPLFPDRITGTDLTIGQDEMQLCEYDMDEQDTNFLMYLNVDFDAGLAGDVFEFLMTSLELECYKIELNYPVDEVDDTNNGNIPCSICLGTQVTNQNAVVFCEGCNLAVHQECYGVPCIPDGPWFCASCLVHQTGNLTCPLCPRMSGAFKRLDDKSAAAFGDVAGWSHVLCALWIPQVNFGNYETLEPISLLHLEDHRWGIQCSICGETSGVCIGCRAPRCTVKYHVSCAQAAGLPMTMPRGVQKVLSEAQKTSALSLCPEHATSQHYCNDIQYDKTPAIDLDKACRLLQREKRDKEKRDKTSYPYWRTTKSSLIAPKIVSDALHRYVQERFNVSIDPEVIQRVCRYWVLKRDSTSATFSRRLRALLDDNRSLKHDERDPLFLKHQVALKKKLLILDDLAGELAVALENDASTSPEEHSVENERTVNTLTPPRSPGKN